MDLKPITIKFYIIAMALVSASTTWANPKCPNVMAEKLQHEITASEEAIAKIFSPSQTEQLQELERRIARLRWLTGQRVDAETATINRLITKVDHYLRVGNNEEALKLLSTDANGRTIGSIRSNITSSQLRINVFKKILKSLEKEQAKKMKDGDVIKAIQSWINQVQISLELEKKKFADSWKAYERIDSFLKRIKSSEKCDGICKISVNDLEKVTGIHDETLMATREEWLELGGIEKFRRNLSDSGIELAEIDSITRDMSYDTFDRSLLEIDKLKETARDPKIREHVLRKQLRDQQWNTINIVALSEFTQHSIERVISHTPAINLISKTKFYQSWQRSIEIARAKRSGVWDDVTNFIRSEASLEEQLIALANSNPNFIDIFIRRSESFDTRRELLQKIKELPGYESLVAKISDDAVAAAIKAKGELSALDEMGPLQHLATMATVTGALVGGTQIITSKEMTDDPKLKKAIDDIQKTEDFKEFNDLVKEYVSGSKEVQEEITKEWQKFSNDILTPPVTNSGSLN